MKRRTILQVATLCFLIVNESLSLPILYQEHVNVHGQVECASKNFSTDLIIDKIELWEEYYTILGRDDRHIGTAAVHMPSGDFDVQGWMRGHKHKLYLQITHNCCISKSVCTGWRNIQADWSNCRELNCNFDIGHIWMETLNETVTKNNGFLNSLNPLISSLPQIP
ncbi:hypothetical protein DdX_19395 [Ditylenchus destructor]|uniref:Uncharacterized protein n=1 Tax=Ditylenchus destructor TaxID=166010 RepID=A0AAD4MMQ0_9BILA|nr:hypothetical protein DdX_19395 [Ditylenchus destructor]